MIVRPRSCIPTSVVNHPWPSELFNSSLADGRRHISPVMETSVVQTWAYTLHDMFPEDIASAELKRADS
jgi:hypothetical protein